MSIKKLLKKGFKNIWKSRWLFLIMFFTQIAFLVVLSYAGIVYYIGAVEHATAMLESVENITAEQIAGMQIPEPYKIYEHYKGMVYNVLMGIIMVYIAFLFLDGINWNLANAIVNRTRHLKEMVLYHLKYVVLFLVFTVPLLLIMLALVKTIALTGSNVQFVLGAVIFGLIAAYFLSISLGICYRYRLRNLTALLNRTFVLGCKKARILVPMSLIIICIYSIAGALLYFCSFSIGLFVLAAVFFILAINWGRVACMTAVREADKCPKQ